MRDQGQIQPPIVFTLPAGARVSAGQGWFPLAAPLAWRSVAWGSRAGAAVLGDVRVVVLIDGATARALDGPTTTGGCHRAEPERRGLPGPGC